MNYTTRVATDADWAAMPDPSDTVGPELVGGPAYMPQGAPVDMPTHDPQTVPVGEPYTKFDGSTAQTKAKITPNTDGTVTVDVFDETLTDTQGNTLPTPTKSDTSEKSNQEIDPCIDNPDRVGCMKAGSDTFVLPKETHTMVFAPEASPISGACPAPISLPNGGTLSFESACDAMTMIRPIVLALAGVMTAFMVIGVMRT